MKTIIAGGRDYELTDYDYGLLNDIEGITEVVSGNCKATGVNLTYMCVDECGEYWAGKNGIPVKLFPADWKTHGKAAGPIRNRQMAEYADAVVLFPGGRGTNSMTKEAHKAGIRIFDYRWNEL